MNIAQLAESARQRLQEYINRSAGQHSRQIRALCAKADQELNQRPRLLAGAVNLTKEIR